MYFYIYQLSTLPRLALLHCDNANPGTRFRLPDERETCSSAPNHYLCLLRLEGGGGGGGGHKFTGTDLITRTDPFWGGGGGGRHKFTGTDPFFSFFFL